MVTRAGIAIFGLVWLAIATLTGYTLAPTTLPTPSPQPTELVDEITLPPLPKTYKSWTRYVDAEFGFNIPYPPDWTMTSVPATQTLAEISLVPPSPPDAIVSVQVIKLQELAAFSDVSAPPFQPIPGYGLLQQGKRFGSQLQTQKLTGEASSSQNGSEQIKSALFKQHGNGYLIQLHYRTEGAADQDLLTTFDAIIEGFRLSQ